VIRIETTACQEMPDLGQDTPGPLRVIQVHLRRPLAGCW
jgi:hypothetical protein